MNIFILFTCCFIVRRLGAEIRKAIQGLAQKKRLLGLNTANVYLIIADTALKMTATGFP